MNQRPAVLFVSLACLALAARAADSSSAPAPAPAPAPSPAPAPAAAAVAPVPASPPANKPPPRQATVEEIRARLLEHLRKKTEKAVEEDHTPKKPSGQAAAKASPGQPAVDPAQPVQVLPKVEIKRMPITELDEKLAQQNQDIAREKKNTEPTPLDETLNGSKISRFFSLFGGQSSDQRATVASERVSMMEDEKDLIEAIADARTKEEKAELEKALADLRANRRELEQDLR